MTAAIIRGKSTLTAHGSDETPVWGPILHSLDPPDAGAKTRIAALVSHIASIQER